MPVRDKQARQHRRIKSRRESEKKTPGEWDAIYGGSQSNCTLVESLRVAGTFRSPQRAKSESNLQLRRMLRSITRRRRGGRRSRGGLRSAQITFRRILCQIEYHDLVGRPRTADVELDRLTRGP